MILLKKILIDSIINKYSKTPPLILGAIWPDGKIKAIAGTDDNSKHPPIWKNANTWRYVPDMKYLNFWQEPSDKEKDIVKDYLSQNGYSVEYVNIYTVKPFKEEQT